MGKFGFTNLLSRIDLTAGLKIFHVELDGFTVDLFGFANLIV